VGRASTAIVLVLAIGIRPSALNGTGKITGFQVGWCDYPGNLYLSIDAHIVGNTGLQYLDGAEWLVIFEKLVKFGCVHGVGFL
jgi:hypothetical protein